ncbi:MAG: sigma-70 family RNA polymerase sigma factor [Oscillibacter sp.]|nr:sigma-70 family RNA polymerase sigma factor [Oscillibacter sp.]
MEDSQIITLYIRRDETAIVETDRKYGPFCRRLAENILAVREDAEECVSDTYHAAWNAIPPEEPRSLRAFLGRIVRNLSISRWRAGRAQKRCGGMEVLLSELEDCVPAGETAEEGLERRVLGELISRWLDGLPAEDRRLFIRRYWYGEAAGALAEETGRTANQMAQRMLRLRTSLRKALEAEGVDL